MICIKPCRFAASDWIADYVLSKDVKLKEFKWPTPRDSTTDGYYKASNGQYVRDTPKGHHRCPCGSGKRYKNCCKSKGQNND